MHYFGKLQVAVVEFSAALKVGDKIRVRGATTDFEKVAESMQVDKAPLKEAKPGDAICVKVQEPARQNDAVCKITF